MYLGIYVLPGKAVRMVPRTKTPANISADASSVISPDEEKNTRRERAEHHLMEIKTLQMFKEKNDSPPRVSTFTSASEREGLKGCVQP